MTPNEQDALIIIDVQNDFCQQGALAVPDGEQVVPVINQLAKKFQTVVLTQDWHPANHASFASSHNAEPFTTTTLHYGEQTLWPDHCVQGSKGAEFHSELRYNNASMIICKGMHQNIDSYSAFFENDRTTPTGLIGYLHTMKIKRVFCAGLAFDFCVRYTAEDAATQMFETIVIENACRAIDMDGSVTDTVQSFLKNEIALLQSSEIN